MTSRADTDGSTLAAGITATATTLQAATGTGLPLWTADPADLPFDIVMSGERITVTDISGPSPNFLTGQSAGFEGGPGTWTGAGNCSLAASTAQAHSGTGSLRLTSNAAGNMTAAHCTAANISTQGLPCSPGDQIVCQAWFLAATTGRTVQAGATFYNTSGTNLATAYGTATADATTGWTKATAVVTAPASAAFCRLATEVLATGAAGEQHYIDDAGIADLTAGSALTQTFTVTRSVNGVVKAHGAGEPIALFQPCYLALA